MYIIKNALISISRNKVRNLLIGCVIFIISCFATVSLAINNTSNSLIKSYESKYEIEATIGFNRENMMKDFNFENKEDSKDKLKDLHQKASNISKENIIKYADSNYVKDYYYIESVNVNLDSIEKAESNDDNFKRKEIKNDYQNADFSLKGYSKIESMNEFIDGNYKITKGKVFDDFESNYGLINSELATLNNLDVGSIIKVIDPVDNKKTYEIIISGIYEENSSDNFKMDMFSNSANMIITSSNFIDSIKENKENNENINVSIVPTFILKSKDVINKFEDEVKEKGLDENLSIENNLNEVEESTKTISNVKTFAVTFLIITLIIGTVILLVINMINIRERKYEIGVLRTIGMKKKMVCMQFIFELFIISFIFLLLGALMGSLVSSTMSNNLLKNEIESSSTQMNNIKENFGKNDYGNKKDNRMDFKDKKFNGVLNVESFNSIDATVDLKVLSELLVIGLLLTLISSISAISSIQRFSPLTILKERT